jgi:hypothetical protein
MHIISGPTFGFVQVGQLHTCASPVQPPVADVTVFWMSWNVARRLWHCADTWSAAPESNETTYDPSCGVGMAVAAAANRATKVILENCMMTKEVAGILWIWRGVVMRDYGTSKESCIIAVLALGKGEMNSGGAHPSYTP